MSSIWVSGPHLGPVHSSLWSGRRGGRVPYKGWLFLYFTSIGGITWAFIAALLLGILASAGLAVIVALAVYGTVSARRATRTRPAATAAAPATWKALHVPASREYQKAHPEGPRDWEPS